MLLRKFLISAEVLVSDVERSHDGNALGKIALGFSGDIAHFPVNIVGSL
ncbi:MAG: hypothetical protein AW09_000503 [Candidatus Accumulibacter phosphatis]|uniref:Uncharacterized protein n=1 Tax=Candidatus Accumulibacter phosphatis TaxID=327160 RepID=A0A080MAQ7_9PROT|nr:MAG: hypothetical protein AW09_000503 [Candidatus Accumulibacter phosphatis]